MTSALFQINVILRQDVHNQLANVSTFLFFKIFNPEKTLLNYPSSINTIVDKAENKGDLLSMRRQGFIDKNGIVYGHMSFFMMAL